MTKLRKVGFVLVIAALWSLPGMAGHLAAEIRLIESKPRTEKNYSWKTTWGSYILEKVKTQCNVYEILSRSESGSYELECFWIARPPTSPARGRRVLLSRETQTIDLARGHRVTVEVSSPVTIVEDQNFRALGVRELNGYLLDGCIVRLSKDGKPAAVLIPGNLVGDAVLLTETLREYRISPGAK